MRISDWSSDVCSSDLRIYSSLVLLDGWRQHLRNSGRSDETTARTLGSLVARFSSLRAISLACTAQLAFGESPVVEASMVMLGSASFRERGCHDVETLVAAVS